MHCIRVRYCIHTVHHAQCTYLHTYKLTFTYAWTHVPITCCPTRTLKYHARAPSTKNQTPSINHHATEHKPIRKQKTKPPGVNGRAQGHRDVYVAFSSYPVSRLRAFVPWPTFLSWYTAMNPSMTTSATHLLLSSGGK